MGLLDNLKSKGSSSSSTSVATFPPPPESLPLGSHDIPRYRKQRGVNLGSWFVLERWICPQAFQGAASPGQSDFDVARGSGAKGVLEAHWDRWITDEDWRWIKARGFNCVRLPVSPMLQHGPY